MRTLAIGIVLVVMTGCYASAGLRVWRLDAQEGMATAVLATGWGQAGPTPEQSAGFDKLARRQCPTGYEVTEEGTMLTGNTSQADFGAPTSPFRSSSQMQEQAYYWKFRCADGGR